MSARSERHRACRDWTRLALEAALAPVSGQEWSVTVIHPAARCNNRWVVAPGIHRGRPIVLGG